MGAEPVPPRREVITGKPTARTRTGPANTLENRLAVRQLMNRQLRAALTVTALLALFLGLLPVLFHLLPATGNADVPLAVWLALGVAPYPALLAIGAWYVRRAERNEGDVTGR
ncbi:LPXTG cell wall anchor domain-containing protein [Streptomyces sp. LaPpAH-108]|uniref:LPXTG cell wall anchor domain-containing protein n=1 Tax=Streptomyces sp. LaPpAH-108 TaxID=1155714 RepID=UPI00035C5108|nr:LPXTG cell wall anchor domain-containing protein [Streptomyces sp. LaPpAH-108]